MKNSKKTKAPRVQAVSMQSCSTKVGSYWWPLPYDKKHRFIPSSVDCLYNQEYFGREEAMMMLRSL